MATKDVTLPNKLQVRFLALPGEQLLHMLPFIALYGKPLFDIVLSTAEGDGKDEKARVQDFLAMIATLGATMLKPEARDGLQELARTLVSGTYILEGGKPRELTQADLGGLFAGDVVSLLVWLYHGLMLNFGSFFAMLGALNVDKTPGQEP